MQRTLSKNLRSKRSRSLGDRSPLRHRPSRDLSPHARCGPVPGSRHPFWQAPLVTRNMVGVPLSIRATVLARVGSQWASSAAASSRHLVRRARPHRFISAAAFRTVLLSCRDEKYKADFPWDVKTRQCICSRRDAIKEVGLSLRRLLSSGLQFTFDNAGALAGFTPYRGLPNLDSGAARNCGAPVLDANSNIVGDVSHKLTVVGAAGGPAVRRGNEPTLRTR